MTYIGLKVQNVPFDGHLMVRYLGDGTLPKHKVDMLKELLTRYENLRFTTTAGAIDMFGNDNEIPVVRVNGVVLTMIAQRLHAMLNEAGFINRGYAPWQPHITLPRKNYPIPKKFIVGPLYIKNGHHPRIYFGA